MTLVQTLLAALLAYVIALLLQVALHVAAIALATLLPDMGSTTIFVAHMAIVALATCLGLVFALQLFRQALPTATAVGVMVIATAAIGMALIARQGRVGMELGIWIADLMPIAFGLFFGRAIARDRLRVEVAAQGVE